MRPKYEFQKSDIEVRYQSFNDGTNLHWHDFYEMEIITEGSGSYYVNGVKYPLKRGSAYLVTPVDFHLIKGEFKLYNISFNDRVASPEIMNRIAAVSAAVAVDFDDAVFSFIEKVLETLDTECRETLSLRTESLKSLMDSLLIRYLRMIHSSEQNQSRSDAAVLRVVSFIKFNFKKKLTLADAADAVGLTPNYLGEIFSKKMGVSFNIFLMQTRLNYAKNLLLRGDCTIEEVARESGFGSQTYFSDCFKKQFGYTPSSLKSRMAPGLITPDEAERVSE